MPEDAQTEGQPLPTDPERATTDQQPVDLREPKGQTSISKTGISVQQLGQYSPEWAAVVKPISWAVMVLLSLLMVIPFVLIWHFSSQVQINVPAGTKPEDAAAIVKAVNQASAAESVKEMLDWAKTFLPSLVGFATAMIGYYFGIRSGTSGQDTTQSPSGQ